MKNQIIILFSLLILFSFSNTFAQTSKNGLVKILSADAVGKLGYRFEVAFNKTSHIIFPSKIVYVDRGSDDIVCSFADNLENVLRIKANKVDFPLETNLTVATDDGNFWAFYITYNEFPTLLNVDVRSLKYNSNTANTDIISKNTDKIFTESKTINKDSVLIENEEMNNAYATEIFNKIGTFTNESSLGDESGRVKFKIQGIYNTDNYIFVRMRIYNVSKLKFRLEKIRFWNVDAVKSKNTSYQEIEIVPIYSLIDNKWQNGGQEVDSKESIEACFMFPLFSIAQNKQVNIQINEYMGGRNGEIIIDYSSFYSNMKGL